MHTAMRSLPCVVAADSVVSPYGTIYYACVNDNSKSLDTSPICYVYLRCIVWSGELDQINMVM